MSWVISTLYGHWEQNQWRSFIFNWEVKAIQLSLLGILQLFAQCSTEVYVKNSIETKMEAIALISKDGGCQAWSLK